MILRSQTTYPVESIWYFWWKISSNGCNKEFQVELTTFDANPTKRKNCGNAIIPMQMHAFQNVFCVWKALESVFFPVKEKLFFPSTSMMRALEKAFKVWYILCYHGADFFSKVACTSFLFYCIYVRLIWRIFLCKNF